ncbi:MAG: hypothetical protein AAGE94_25250, partial [Acidobacteriota bacterium]
LEPTVGDATEPKAADPTDLEGDDPTLYPLPVDPPPDPDAVAEREAATLSAGTASTGVESTPSTTTSKNPTSSNRVRETPPPAAAAPTPRPAPPPPPPQADELLYQAERLEREGKVHSAAEATDRVLAIEPGNSAARRLRSGLTRAIERRERELADELEDHLEEIEDDLGDRDLDDFEDDWIDDALPASSRARLADLIDRYRSLRVTIRLERSSFRDFSVDFVAHVVVEGKEKRFGGEYATVLDKRWNGRYTDTGRRSGFEGAGP